jgi:hypothetical protein
MSLGPPLTPPHYFDYTDPDGPQNNPLPEAGWLLDRLVDAARADPRWIIDDDSGRTVDLVVIEHQRGQGGTVAITGGPVALLLRLAVDASGYVRAAVELAGTEIWRGYIDRPYEELDIWPPGAVFEPRRTVEAPGRIGKRLTWLVLDSRPWPALAPAVNDKGFLLARVPD